MRSTILAFSLFAFYGLCAGPKTSTAQVIGLGGALPNLASVQLESSHVYDYTFSSAPTDWRIQSGDWGMKTRWACSPGWNWFGGGSREVAAIWNKRKFSGDISVQFYCGFLMEYSGTFDPRSREGRFWEYGSDVGITIGDGHNLSSGYTFLLGADENTHTLLKRQTETVAETRDTSALFPTWYDGRPGEVIINGWGYEDQNVPGTKSEHSWDRLEHRRWWYVRVDKIGSKVSCYLDNRLIFSYDDPQPLDAGQVALWTYNNGIALSRVQIYYDREIKPVREKSSRVAKPSRAESDEQKYARTSR